jgi:GTPase SAR1 family protein
MLDLMVEKILAKAAESATTVLVDAVKRKNDELRKRHEQMRRKNPTSLPEDFSATLTSTVPVLRNALQTHVSEIKRWSDQVRFSDLRGSKSILQIYVDLDTYLMPLNVHEDESEKQQTKPLLKAIQEDCFHCVILGTAGAGKTTSIQKICSDFFVKGKVLGRHNFPILIKLRDLSGTNKSSSILTSIQNTLAINIKYRNADEISDPEFISSIEKRLLLDYLDNLNAVILLDGFDELATEKLREQALGEILFLAEGLRHSRLIVTSRSSDFRYKLATLQKFEIAPLTHEQVSVFAARWLDSNSKAEDLLHKVFASPYSDTTIRPLNLAHLCAIYERIQDIPEKPKSVYRRIVQLLLEDWDSQRQIKRPSAYANFDHDRKFEFLAQLAFCLTSDLQQLRFTTASLKSIYKNIHADHNLPGAQAMQVVAELESHNGLIIESGRDHFEFAHKSIQEYLAADYIVRLPTLELIESQLVLLPNELAIAVSLSSKPSLFLAEIFLKSVNLEKESTTWFTTFIARLLMEKPEFHAGSSLVSAIASMHLITRLNGNSEAINLLGQALPENTEKLIARHYRVSVRNTKLTSFGRISHASGYKLPEFLHVPTRLFET